MYIFVYLLISCCTRLINNLLKRKIIILVNYRRRRHSYIILPDLALTELRRKFRVTTLHCESETLKRNLEPPIKYIVTLSTTYINSRRAFSTNASFVVNDLIRIPTVHKMIVLIFPPVISRVLSRARNSSAHSPRFFIPFLEKFFSSSRISAGICSLVHRLAIVHVDLRVMDKEGSFITIFPNCSINDIN